jgi:RNA polymerase sigma-70 factor (ECF subfamily)
VNQAPLLNELELIRLYKNTGNNAYVGQLYTRYTSLVYGVCLKYLKDRDDSKDAVMQIFEKVLKSLLLYEIVNFKSWLYTTAKNHCLMELRSKKGKTTIALPKDSMENGLVMHLEEEGELEQDIHKLEKCMEELGDDQKQCVKLFFIKETAYKDIVALTGLDMNQVKSYIQNGKRNLKICMERNE